MRINSVLHRECCTETGTITRAAGYISTKTTSTSPRNTLSSSGQSSFYRKRKKIYSFSQEEFSADDPANPCANYPTPEYGSYEDCDDHFVRRILPAGLKPFWAVYNLSQATDTFTLRTEVYKSLDWEDLFTGILPSDCLQPCLQTVATVEEGVISSFYPSMISLAFSDQVRVKRTSVDRFSFMDSLNFFGSNLGLWPGLGLYQIIESIVGILLAGQVLNRILLFCRKPTLS